MKNDKTLHIWKIPLNIPESELPPLFALLSNEEKETAKKFRFEKHRRRYIASHSAMQSILAQQLNIPVQNLQIQAHENGKPYIPHTPLHFNLSHSEELALLVLSSQAEVGIDIEHLKPDIDTIGISKRFFHPIESEQLQRLPPEKRLKHFYCCWTGKEAYLKAKGVGITHHLKLFALNFQDPEKIHLVFVTKELEEFNNWFVHSFQLDNDYTATVVSSTKPNTVLFHDYDYSRKAP